ncbi:p115 like vesicle tethering protein [Russula aff. rugulosa BPL654]|nr:p115 like vesicle tethering protein [Russula aff. rugulosa BPL654]
MIVTSAYHPPQVHLWVVPVSLQYSSPLLSSPTCSGTHRTAKLGPKIIPRPLTALPASSAASGAFFIPTDGKPLPHSIYRRKLHAKPRKLTVSSAAYLSLLSQWLWEDPRTVREFLEAGGLGVLVKQLDQSNEIDVVVPGLCAFLLGACYEFNHEAGEVTRVKMRSELTRLGADVLVDRMDRMRDGERLKVVMTDSWVLPYPTREAEIWFNWALVVFWKEKKDTIQRRIVADSDSASSSTAQERILVDSIRRVTARQAAEIKTLQNKLKELTATSVAAAETAACEISRSSAKFAGQDERSREWHSVEARETESTAGRGKGDDRKAKENVRLWKR